MMSRLVIATFVALSLGSAAIGAEPANDNQAMLAALQALDSRVAETGYRLAVAGVPFCPDAVARSGFLVHGLVQYQPALRADAGAYFGLRDAPVVLAVMRESAAARAGLRVGDAIIRLAGADVSRTMAANGGKASFEPVRSTETMIENALRQGPLTLTVERDGQSVELVIPGDRGCASRFQLDPSNSMNASSDGTYVKISSRIAEFTESEDELALLLAHELSHNILKHRERLEEQGVSHGLFRSLGKNPGRIRATEEEADRLALYLMARAGYDISVAPAFWDRFERKAGPGILSDGTHASRRERVSMAEREIAVIRAQQAKGALPTPDWLGGGDTPPQQSPSQVGFRR